jgi:hypothetical protein
MAANEGFILGTLDLNDETSLVTESVKFTPAALKPVWAQNSAADGDALVDEPHYENAVFEMTIRVLPKDSMDESLEVLGELTDAVQECARAEGGQEFVWLPAESTTPYTWYAVLGEMTELPIDLASGWLFKSPTITVKLTCRPFGYMQQRTILEATESGADPLQTIYVGGVEGDVRAEATLILSDASEIDRRFAQWGRDVVSTEENPDLLIEAGDLVTEGFSGEAIESSEAYGEEVVKATAINQYSTTMCSTGRIEHVGSYAVYLRLNSGTDDSTFRMSYRNGNGPLLSLEWQKPPAIGVWTDVYLGEVFLDERVLGFQTSEILIEHQTATSGLAENEVNYLTFIPTTGTSGVARGVLNARATKLIAFDNFAPDEELKDFHLDEREPDFPPSAEWAEVNKTGASGLLAYTFTSGGVKNEFVYRYSTDSSVNSGCFALLGSGEYGTFQSSVVVSHPGTHLLEGASRIGLLGRYKSKEKWVMAVLVRYSNIVYLEVLKNMSGTVTSLGAASTGILITTSGSAGLIDGMNAAGLITFTAVEDGSWSATCGTASLTGHDNDLAADGTLATGRAGLYDAYVSSEEKKRQMEAFKLLGAEASDRACYAEQSIEFRSDGALRMDATGTYAGPPSVYRGSNFYLDPAGSSGRINRIATRMRRSDIAQEQDATVTDKQTVEVKVRERVLKPR